MKMANKPEPDIQDDPKPLDRVNWQRFRIAADHEAIHRDWGCVLYTIHRGGRITNDEREAGDRYAALVLDYRKIWKDHMGSIEVYRDTKYECLENRSPLTTDVEHSMGLVLADALAEDSACEVCRAKRIGRRYKEAASIAGSARNILEDLLIN